MDCRKSLVLALGLAGAVGCVPQSEVQQQGPCVPPPGAVVEKIKDLPRHAPRSAETCVALGNVFAAEGGSAGQGSARQERLYDQARREYEQALDVDATCLSAYLALGQLCTKTCDHEAAVKWYRKGLEKRPGEAKLWFELGMSYRSHKEWGPAVEALRHAVALDGDNKQYHNMLGCCLVCAGRPDEALADFLKGSGEGQAHYRMAFMLHYLGQDAEARQHLQIAVQKEPTFEPAQQMLAQLEGREPAAPVAAPAGADAPAH
jgi:tetratricopeptide (TPR) repeat protein